MGDYPIPVTPTVRMMQEPINTNNVMMITDGEASPMNLTMSPTPSGSSSSVTSPPTKILKSIQLGRSDTATTSLVLRRDMTVTTTTTTDNRVADSTTPTITSALNIIANPQLFSRGRGRMKRTASSLQVTERPTIGLLKSPTDMHTAEGDDDMTDINLLTTQAQTVLQQRYVTLREEIRTLQRLAMTSPVELTMPTPPPKVVPNFQKVDDKLKTWANQLETFVQQTEEKLNSYCEQMQQCIVTAIKQQNGTTTTQMNEFAEALTTATQDSLMQIVETQYKMAESVTTLVRDLKQQLKQCYTRLSELHSVNAGQQSNIEKLTSNLEQMRLDVNFGQQSQLQLQKQHQMEMEQLKDIYSELYNKVQHNNNKKEYSELNT